MAHQTAAVVAAAAVVVVVVVVVVVGMTGVGMAQALDTLVGTGRGACPLAT
jgi:hypothetical protein